jgi:hypothetical protein
MAYVPGFQHDVFVSYAHGDDRDWINRFLDRLKPALGRLLGFEAEIWIDEDSLRKSRDYRKDIPDSVKSSAVFLLLPSPTYIRSRYCVEEECRSFGETVTGRRGRFADAEFASELFALRCPILPVENNEQRELFQGLTDIPFCDDLVTFPIGSQPFEASFRKLVGEMVNLLRRMRNHSTPIFLYPRYPGPDLNEIHKMLAAEISAQSYRLLPDRNVNLPGQLREACLSVFLLGESYDETARELTDIAAQEAKPWVIWSSSAGEQRSSPQKAFCRHLEGIPSITKTYLNAAIPPVGLKDAIFEILRPDSRAVPLTRGKPSVYLIYNSHDSIEIGNAGQIIVNYQKEFHFEVSDDPAQHTLRLTNSDGVLLVWGNADEEWCASEFEQMVRAGWRAEAKGLCLFAPKESKVGVVNQIRQSLHDIYITEQFGPAFEPARMEAFFNPVRRRAKAGLT